MIVPSPKSFFPTLGLCPPASAAASGTITSGGTYLAIPRGATKLKITLFVGTVGSSPTHALSANQATSSGGAGSKACAGISGTFGTVANSVVQLDFDIAQVVDVNGGFAFLQIVLTNNSGSASIMGAEIETDGSFQ